MDDKVSGYAVLFGSLLGIVCYFYLLFLSPWTLLTVQISAFPAVTAVLMIMAWIGYSLATTPSPMPLEDWEEESSTEEERGESAEI